MIPIVYKTIIQLYKVSTLNDFHFPFNSNKLQLFGGSVSVVKEELLARLYGPLGKDADTMIAGHHHDLGITVGIDGVVGKPNLVSFASSIHNKIVVQIK